jgi:hypothetical protein
MTTMEISPEVQRGVEWFDAQAPGWDRDIMVWRLRVNTPGECPIGQTFGDYNRFLRETGRTDDWAIAHGLLSGKSFLARYRDHARLSREWRQVIRERQAEDA